MCFVWCQAIFFEGTGDISGWIKYVQFGIVINPYTGELQKAISNYRSIWSRWNPAKRALSAMRKHGG